MLFRAIRYINEGDGYDGKLFTLKHFDSGKDAYKWLVPSLEIQQKERWHIRLFESIGVDFSDNKNMIMEVGRNEPLNPEQTPVTRFYIQKVEYMDSPLPLL